jgi:hypothetical protein
MQAGHGVRGALAWLGKLVALAAAALFVPVEFGRQAVAFETQAMPLVVFGMQAAHRRPPPAGGDDSLGSQRLRHASARADWRPLLELLA